MPLARRRGLRLVFSLAVIASLSWISLSKASAEDSDGPRRLEIIGLLKARTFEAIEARAGGDGRVPDGFGYHFSYSDPAIEADLNAWVEARPESPLPYAARASYYHHIGAERRGTKYAGETHRRQFAEMRRYYLLAVRDYRQALVLDQGYGGAYASLIGIANSLGDEAAANRMRREGLNKARNTFSIHWTMIRRLEPKWGGSWEEVQTYIANLQRTHRDGEYKALTGYFDQLMAARLYNKHDYKAALEHNDRAIATGDTMGRQRLRAKILLELERVDEAFEAVNTAIDYAPDGYSNYVLRAGMHHGGGQDEEALRDIEFALSLDPYNRHLLHERAKYTSWAISQLPPDTPEDDIAALRDTEERYYLDALVHGQFNADVHERLGQFYSLVRHDKERSSSHHLRALELMPEEPWYWLAFAQSLARFYDCRAVEAARSYLRMCEAEDDCTPDLDEVNNVNAGLWTCRPPEMSGDIELPLAPRHAAKLKQLLRCDDFFGIQDDAEAIRACLELAQTEDADAQFDMGLLYVFSGSDHSVRDAGQAHLALGVEWLLKALAQDHTGAMAVLGKMYLHGVSVPQDLAKALSLLGRAAERDNVEAVMGLGMAYHRAIGVTKDHSKAEQYYRRALELGERNAAKLLVQLYREQG